VKKLEAAQRKSEQRAPPIRNIMSDAENEKKKDTNSKEEPDNHDKKDQDWMYQLVLQGLKMGLENSGENAEYDPVQVFEKLQEIMSIVVSRVDEVSNDLPWWCFVSVIQLNESIKKHHPEYRDRSYRDGGEVVSIEELEELSEGVELAEWAYEDSYAVLKKNLREKDYVLLRHEMSCEFGHVGHYIAINHKSKIALIGLKGTSTFSDLVTDATGKAIEHTLGNSFDESYLSKEIRCHEGIWTAALTMADDLEELVSNLFLPSGYRVLICGHSLGAGAACLLGLLLRSRISDLRGDKLRVLAIASPPVLNYDAALATSSFCTSIVNNNDVVPRMSLSNLVKLAKMLVRVDSILKERDLKPCDVSSALRYVKDLMQSDSEPIMSCEEVDEIFSEENVLTDDEDDLFVPGRVVTMWYLKDKTEGDAAKKAKIEGDENPLKVVESEGTEGDKEKSDDSEQSESKEHSKDEIMAAKIEKEMARIKEIDVVGGTGGMRMLRQIELESSFLDDHGTEFYQASIQTLLKKMSD